MTLVGALRGRLYAPEVEARVAAYAGAEEQPDPGVQLELLNREWSRVRVEVPHYAALTREDRLPARFGSLEEFAARVPPTRRADVQAQVAERTSRGRAADFRRMTGGSTAQPVQLPAWKSELAATRADVWMARGWYGIAPRSRLFLLWGHSHLLGRGPAAWLRARRRELSDRLLGYRRASAYDLRPERLREAARAMLRFRPDYVIGYSVALDLFARANLDLAPQLRSLQLKVVLATAESFPHPDSAAQLGRLFGCPVGMEYGAVETGLIAQTEPGGAYRALWQSHLLEAERQQRFHQLRVTSLYPRAFPLVRYEIGDEIELPAGAPDRVVGLVRFQRVVGRCNDYVSLADGTVVHSEAFTHAVRPCAEIRGYQIVCDPQSLRIDYVADVPLSGAGAAEVLERLSRIHPTLADVRFQRVEQLRQTLAGKVRMVLRESP